MNPIEQYDPNQQANMPGVYGQPSSTPLAPGQVPFGPPRPKKNSRMLIIIGVVAGSMLLLIIILVIALTAGKKPVTPTKDNSDTTQVQGPQAASAIDVEQTNNAISQDISGLNDDQDFPDDKLDDKNLKL